LKRSIFLGWSLIFLVLGCETAWANEQAVAQAILKRVELQRNLGTLVIAGHSIASRHVLPKLYERRAE
jgi:hypothetical protein